MPDVSDQVVIDAQAQLRSLKSLSQLVLDRQGTWESNPERTSFVARARDVIKYCRDDLDAYLDSMTSPGQPHTEQNSSMFTSRVMSTLEDASDAFNGNLFVASGWFGYEITDDRLQQRDDIQAWLQRVTEFFEDAIAEANFYPQMPNVTMDSLSVGDGIMFVGEDERQDRAYCHYWETLNTWFIRNQWGDIIAVHHRWRFSALEAYTRWGTKCSKSVIEAAEGNRPAESFAFIQSIYRHADPLVRDRKFERERPFIELWIQEDSEKNDLNYSPADGRGGNWSDRAMNGILGQGGYSSMPVMDWPYWWKSSTTYGRSPLHLVSVKRLHAMWKSTLLGVNRNAAPPLLAPQALEALLDLNPDGVTWLPHSNEMSDVQEVYKNGIDVSGNLELINLAQEEVRDMLKLNVFLAMTLKTKDMRVDEVMHVIGEQAALLSPRIGLLSSLFMDKLHARMWTIEAQRGRIAATEPPAIIDAYMRTEHLRSAQKGRKFKGLPIRVIYKGPLQIAQDSYFAQRRLAAGLAPIMTYLQPIDPDAVADTIDVPVAVEETLDRMGFMQNAIRSKERVAARQKDRADSQRALLEAQTAKEGAGAVREAAQADQIARGGA